jgi:maltose O-acetyltransferase
MINFKLVAIRLRWFLYYLLTIKYRCRFKKIGKNVYIHPTVKFSGCKNITIGNNVRFIGYSDIRGAGGLDIGDNCSIAPNCTILSTSHRYKGARLLPYDYGTIDENVRIGNNVWLGQNVSINSGVDIGNGAIVGLSSVVVKRIPDLAIVGGNPAKIIKYRDKDHYKQLEKEAEGAWYNLLTRKNR